MYHFEGQATLREGSKSEASFDLGLTNFLPRGAVVCNCMMYALVVYTGIDTKII